MQSVVPELTVHFSMCRVPLWGRCVSKCLIEILMLLNDHCFPAPHSLLEGSSLQTGSRSGFSCDFTS